MALPSDGTKFSAYCVVVTPETIVMVEKPGRNRGDECPGGHGAPEDASLEECAARELLEETGIDVEPEDMKMIGAPVVKPTYISAVFLVYLSTIPKTIRKIGSDGEIVHIRKRQDVIKGNVPVWPPHLADIKCGIQMNGGL